MNSPRSIYSNMNPWLSICGLFFSVLKSLLGIARQCSREKFAILSLRPWGQVRILIYWTWLLLTITARRPYWSFSWVVTFKSWWWMLTITCFSETRQGWATFSGKFLLGPKRFLYDSTEISGNRNIIFLTPYFCRPLWPPCHVFASQEYWQMSLWFVKPFFFKKGYKYLGSSLSSLNVGLILPHSSHLSFYVETRICFNNWKPNSGPFAQKTAQ